MKDTSTPTRPHPIHDCFFVFSLDPKVDAHLMLDGKKVFVPQGKPVGQPKYNSSSFSQSEYLVYKESQNRIRYLLEFKFH